MIFWGTPLTYRLWDYGRPREIHVEQAVPIFDLTVHPGAVKAESGELVRSAYFVTELVTLKAGQELTPKPEESQIWICLAGGGAMGGERFVRGDVWLLPDPVAIRAKEDARFLRTYAPAPGVR